MIVRSRLVPASLLLAGLTLAGGCSSTDPAARLTRELLGMPKEEAYAKGDALCARKKYDPGRQYLRFVAENYANDPIGKQAALRLADSYFEEKTPLGFLEAQARYRDFRNRYPSHPRSDYALYRLALCADRQAERADRDQANTRIAANSYRELMQQYPDSPYSAEARLRQAAMRELLAEHEFRVAHFYFKRRAWKAAKGRFDTILAVFPEYKKMEQTLYEAGLAEYRLGHEEDARILFAKLRQDFPKSELVRKLPKAVVPAPAPPAAAAESAPAAPAPGTAVAPALPVPEEVAKVAAPRASESPPAAKPPPQALSESSPDPSPRGAATESPARAPSSEVPVPAARDRWAVHFASYQKRENAEKDAGDLGRRLGEPTQVVRVEIPGRGTWYRVLVGAFATEREARQLRARAAGDQPGPVYRLPAR